MPDFDETLLSAYLDGELPPGERARVEGWLAEQPESRQLLEELRCVKASLQRLPRDRLAHDFPEQVLRQAEREILTSSGDAQPARGLTWHRLRRPVLWASLALAAGLLLMVFDRDRQPAAPARQVALAPKEMPQDGPAIGAPVGETAVSGEKLRDDLPGSSAVPGPASGPAAMPAAAAPADESLPQADEPRGRMRESGMQAGAAGNRSGRMRRTEYDPVPALIPRTGEANHALAQDAEDQRAATLSDQALLVWCEVSPDSQYNERFRQLLLSNSITWSDAAEKQAAGRSPLGGRLHGEKAAKEPMPPQAPASDEEPEAKAIAKKPRSKKTAPAPSAAPNGRQAAGRGGAYFGQFAPSQNQRRLLEAGQAALEAEAELVLVEASEPQIKAVLAELDRDDDVFKAVDVEPAADAPRQQQFGQYRRGAIPARELAQRKAGVAQKKEQADKAEADRAPAEPSANEDKQTAQRGFAYRVRAGGDAAGPALQLEALDETKRVPLTVGENRLQVLFVLQPTDDPKPATAPPDEKNQD